MTKVLDHARKEQEAKILQLKMDLAAQQASANERANAFSDQDARWKAHQSGMLAAVGAQVPGMTRPDYAQGNIYPSETLGANADLAMANMLPGLAEKGAASQIATDTDKFNKQTTLLNTLLSGASNMSAAGIKGSAAVQAAGAKAGPQLNNLNIQQNQADQKLDLQRQTAYNNAARSAFDQAFHKAAMPKKDSGLFDTNPNKTTYQIINDESEPETVRNRFLDRARQVYSSQLQTAAGFIPKGKEAITKVMSTAFPVTTIDEKGQPIRIFLTVNQLRGLSPIRPDQYKTMKVKSGDEDKAREAWKADAIEALTADAVLPDVARRYAIAQLWNLQNFGASTVTGGNQ